MEFESPFPSGVAFAAEPWPADGAGLLPAERAAGGFGDNTARKRVREYAAGRIAARRALAVFQSPTAILRAGRAPVWPAGLVGTITHSEEWALAAVAPTSVCGGLGLDLEAVSRNRRPAVARYFVDDAERAWVGEDLTSIITVFSAKEAVFKALFPRVGEHFGYDAVTLSAPEAGRLVARLNRPLGPGYPTGARVAVRVQRVGRFVVSSVCLPPDGPAR